VTELLTSVPVPVEEGTAAPAAAGDGA
jgi:hypothetical protein